MLQLGQQAPLGSAKEPVSLREQWTSRYGPLVAEQLRPDRRYTLVRVGSVEFAYTDYDRYLRALGQAWGAGLVPDPLPSTTGTQLLGITPNLRGVDLDLADLSDSDVAPPQSRFS